MLPHIIVERDKRDINMKVVDCNMYKVKNFLL